MSQKNLMQIKAKYQLDSFLAECGVVSCQNIKILEIGFKNGLFLNKCRLAGMDAVGTEINPEFHRQVQAEFPDLQLILCDGETIPQPDDSFDIVVSFQVLEHVASLKTLIGECSRLLKPGGIMYHCCPNYFSFYEGHYGIIWLPFLNKTLGRGYLKLIRRYSPYYESLNIIKPSKLKKLLSRHRQLEILSLGRREFVDNFSEDQISKINQPMIRKLLKLMLKLPRLNKIFLSCVSQVGLYYPIKIIAVKRN